MKKFLFSSVLLLLCASALFAGKRPPQTDIGVSAFPMPYTTDTTIYGHSGKWAAASHDMVVFELANASKPGRVRCRLIDDLDTGYIYMGAYDCRHLRVMMIDLDSCTVDTLSISGFPIK